MQMRRIAQEMLERTDLGAMVASAAMKGVRTAGTDMLRMARKRREEIVVTHHIIRAKSKYQGEVTMVAGIEILGMKRKRRDGTTVIAVPGTVGTKRRSSGGRTTIAATDAQDTRTMKPPVEDTNAKKFVTSGMM